MLFRFFCLCAGLFISHAVDATPAWLEDYAGEIKAQARQHNVPGYSLVVYQRGREPWFFHHGKTHQGGESVDKNTVFRLASVSKTFTAALVGKLVEQHQLDWQTPLPQLAPQYGLEHAGASRIQLKHLISQSSGYMPNAYDNLIEANYSVKRVLNELADLKPICAPGRCYTYQNALFGVLEMYFRDHGSSYEENLNRQLLNPLFMETASVGKAKLESSAKWARPHVAIDKSHWRKTRVKSNYYRFSPAAGVNASSSDMHQWLQAMMGDKPEVVSPQLIERLTSPQVKTKRELWRREWKQHLKDAHYGLGWRLYDFDGHAINYHGGWVQGYRADVAFAPQEGIGVALLINAETNLINKLTADFWERYFNRAQPPMSLQAAAAD